MDAAQNFLLALDFAFLLGTPTIKAGSIVPGGSVRLKLEYPVRATVDPTN